MKKINIKIVLSVAFFLIITIFSSQSVFSQSVWVQDFKNRSKAGVELMVPSYSFTGDQRGVDFVTFFYTDIRLSKTWLVNFSFPFSRFNGGGSKLNSGNPFIGFQYFSPNSGFKMDFGATIPTIQQNQFGPYLPRGALSSYGVDAFNELITAVKFNIHYQWNSESNWIYNVGQGLSGIASANGPLALVFKFYGQALYKVDDHLRIGTGLDGDLLTNSDHYLFQRRNRIQLGLVGLYNGLGKVDVGAYVKKNMYTAFNNEPNIVIGLNFDVPF